MKETPILFRCTTDDEVCIINSKDIIIMEPVISQNNDIYIRVEFWDDEMCITNSIYCKNVEVYNIC